MAIDWTQIITADDLAVLGEDFRLEAKAAQGRDGRGALPQSALETYSAFANTSGGVILLGVEEQDDGTLHLCGLGDAGKVRRELWDALHNSQRVSSCLLAEEDVRELAIKDLTVLAVHVPQADRRQRPVHLGGNPFGNTFRRNYEGDYRCDDETVRRMLAEQVEEERDARVLRGYGIHDLEESTFRAYRTLFANLKPEHPFSEADDSTFLHQIGGWRQDRETGSEGLTLAGLLMFGKEHHIRDLLPHYHLDYQERPEARAERRWVDRLTLDGTWSGNLYDFYRKVYARLTADLKVPFALDEDQRQEETPVHTALREALVNTLIHADYSGRVSVLVVKRPDLFGFRNPGNMRVPLARAMAGGESDCRNRRLQRMFSLIGRGEQAGSGIPKIMSGWGSQHWRRPTYTEVTDPEQTQLALRMVSLLPDQTVARLEQAFGDKFRALDETGRLALCTADLEGTLTHARLMGVTDTHPRDLSALLTQLCREGLLESEGATRGKVYFLPGRRPAPSDDTFDAFLGQLRDAADSSQHTDSSSPRTGDRSQHSETDDEPEPVGDLRETLVKVGEELADRCASQRRIRRDRMRLAILLLCICEYRSASTLARRLNRDQGSLSNHYLRAMVHEKLLNYRNPANPTDPDQAYIASKRGGMHAVDGYLQGQAE